ncbi:GntR family transcriptional regulator [Aliiroseovarius sp. Z3]|uniref:GntR family transcriptional regulator n=1 Tax=Aliiroseovarius sp. Z3 TaxID=2811402 RepID=UPI0023B25FCC|nr:GntR family transcriptional regulator [Aliiroseovarius sp. Z3]
MMIEAEGLKVGDRLPPEVEIARRLGIGRAKVREALTSWQNMGIVVRNKKQEHVWRLRFRPMQSTCL